MGIPHPSFLNDRENELDALTPHNVREMLPRIVTGIVNAPDAKTMNNIIERYFTPTSTLIHPLGTFSPRLSILRAYTLAHTIRRFFFSSTTLMTPVQITYDSQTRTATIQCTVRFVYRFLPVIKPVVQPLVVVRLEEEDGILRIWEQRDWIEGWGAGIVGWVGRVVTEVLGVGVMWVLGLGGKEKEKEKR